MPTFKLGVLRRHIIEEMAVIEIDAATQGDALEIARKIGEDDRDELAFGKEELVDTTIHVGAFVGESWIAIEPED